MKIITRLNILVLLVAVSSLSCEKEKLNTSQCGCDSETIEIFENTEGTIMLFDSVYYIQLHLPTNEVGVVPCDEWSDDLKVKGLEIEFSGELKKGCPSGKPNTKVFSPNPVKVNYISKKNEKK